MNKEIVYQWIDKLKDAWLNKKTRSISIGTAIALVTFYTIYDKLLLPPPKLRHLPYAPVWKTFYNMLKRKSYGYLSRELYIPLLDKDHEVFIKKDFLGWTVQVVDPESVKQIAFKSDIFPKADINVEKGTLRNMLLGSENIVFTHKEEVWRKHRMLLNAPFHKAMPVKLFADLTHKMFNVMDETIDQPIDATDIIERFTLDVIGKAGFDFDFHAITDVNSEWVMTYYAIRKSLQEPLFFIFPFLEKKLLWMFPERRRKHGLVKKFFKMLDDVIVHKRHALESHKDIEEAEKDLLTLMLESELRGEGALSNDEIKSDLNIFFIAGHDTTANTLSSVIYYLSKYPDVQQRAREEVINVLGDDPKDIHPTSEQLKELVYLNQIIKETLRMNGPLITSTPRITVQDTVVSGAFIPKHTPIVASIYDLHHNPNVWQNPEVFNPDRFQSGGEAELKDRKGLSWNAFGSGKRMCLGMNFSLAEQRVLLSSLLRKYEWSLPEDSIHKDVLLTSGVGGILTPAQLDICFKRRY
ncbi:unnamed protein product [Cunninghamella blakesleeana]